MKLPLYKVRIPDPEYPGTAASILVYEVGPLADVGARHPAALEVERLGDVEMPIANPEWFPGVHDEAATTENAGDAMRYALQRTAQRFEVNPDPGDVDRSSPPAALIKCSLDGCTKLKEDPWVCMSNIKPKVETAGRTCAAFNRRPGDGPTIVGVETDRKHFKIGGDPK